MSLTIDEKCENLMNVVVESRKRFGKMCVDYEQKTSLMENKILNLQLETIPHYSFKTKHSVPDLDVAAMSQDIDEFAKEIDEKQKRIENLKKKLRNTQEVVQQLKADNLGSKLRMPITADNLLAQAKEKKL